MRRVLAVSISCSVRKPARPLASFGRLGQRDRDARRAFPCEERRFPEGKETVMPTKQGDVGLLRDPVAQQLLQS